MRFVKYFHISREHFEMIYQTSALSGQFGLHPDDPMLHVRHSRLYDLVAWTIKFLNDNKSHKQTSSS